MLRNHSRISEPLTDETDALTGSRATTIERGTMIMRPRLRHLFALTMILSIVILGLFARSEGFGKFHSHYRGQSPGSPAPSKEDASQPPHHSTPAPEFRVKDLNGRTLSLASLKGKVVIVDFWATWCPPCRLEIPTLNELQARYGERGLEIIAISLDETADEIRAFMKQTPLNYTVVHGDEAIMAQFGGIAALPTTFFLDRRGSIRQQHVGLMSREAMERVVRQLLDER